MPCCRACCSPDHSRRLSRNLFTTTETRCVEHAGCSRVMFRRGGICFLAITKMAQLQTNICLGSSTESATAAWRGYSWAHALSREREDRNSLGQHAVRSCFKGRYVNCQCDCYWGSWSLRNCCCPCFQCKVACDLHHCPVLVLHNFQGFRTQIARVQLALHRK